MRLTWLWFFCLLSPLGIFSQYPDKSILNSITSNELKEHLTFLASDRLKGRETGTPELRLAAKYLAAQLNEYGFKGAGSGGSFFQRVPLHETTYDQSSLVLSYDGKQIAVKPGRNIAVYNRNSTADYEVSDPVVFIGTGFKGNNLEDLNRAAIEGKVVIRYDLDDKYRYLEKKNYKFSHRGIRDHLFDLGAEAVVLVVRDDQRAVYLIDTYSGFSSDPQVGLSTISPDPYIIVTKSVFDELLRLENLDRLPDKNYSFKNKLCISMNVKHRSFDSYNVVGILKGSDPDFAGEYVGYSAHYDHLGVKDGRIYNGADDDGSGTVAVLEIAEAISRKPPRRSTLIIFHTAEEKGLLGSEYFTNNPLIDLNKLVALFNIDMIGRSKEADDTSFGNRKTSYANEIYLIGADKLSTELNDISRKTNSRITNLKLNYLFNDINHPDNYYKRSDHYNYVLKGVPIIFYFDGGHVDYHKPTDTVDKIDFAKIKRVSDLILATGYYVQNKSARLRIDLTIK